MKWVLMITLYYTSVSGQYVIKKIELETFSTREKCVEQIIPTIEKSQGMRYPVSAGAEGGTFKVECRDSNGNL